MGYWTLSDAAVLQVGVYRGGCSGDQGWSAQRGPKTPGQPNAPPLPKTSASSCPSSPKALPQPWFWKRLNQLSSLPQQQTWDDGGWQSPEHLPLSSTEIFAAMGPTAPMDTCLQQAVDTGSDPGEMRAVCETNRKLSHGKKIASTLHVTIISKCKKPYTCFEISLYNKHILLMVPLFA